MTIHSEIRISAIRGHYSLVAQLGVLLTTLGKARQVRRAAEGAEATRGPGEGLCATAAEPLLLSHCC